MKPEIGKTYKVIHNIRDERRLYYVQITANDCPPAEFEAEVILSYDGRRNTTEENGGKLFSFPHFQDYPYVLEEISPLKILMEHDLLMEII